MRITIPIIERHALAQLQSNFNSAVHDYRLVWKTLAITDIVYKIIAFLILTSVVGLAFRTMLRLSGRTVLADEDILYFLIEPVGWVSVIIVGALWLGIFALEQAALMAILSAAAQGHHLSYIGALQFALVHSRAVLRLTARLVSTMLLVIAPFLLVVGFIYIKLLTEYDINFYLTERPPVFILAVSLTTIILIAAMSLILRLLSSWFFALPLVLFENTKVSKALSLSGKRAQGHRLRILKWLVGWALVNVILSASIPFLVISLGRLMVPGATAALLFLVLTIGVILALWLVSNLLLNMLASTSFAAVLFNVYCHFGKNGELYRAPSIHKTIHSYQSRVKVTRKKILISSLAALIMSFAIGLGVLYDVQLEDHTDIIAHRGASATTPENTMAAVIQAIAEKADWVEIDVQETADGDVVVFHDSDFMKLANNNLKIWDATISDLKSIDIGSHFSQQFKEQRVPLLCQVLVASKGKIRVIIELKYYGHDQQLEQRVAEIVEAEGMQSEVMIMSLKSDKVQKMKALRPLWKVGLLASAAIGNLANADADFLAVNAGLATRDFIRSVHENDKQIYAWTVNDTSTMSTLIGRGVDGLITDKPALAQTVLEHRSNINLLGRILLELTEILGVPPEIREQ